MHRSQRVARIFYAGRSALAIASARAAGRKLTRLIKAPESFGDGGEERGERETEREREGGRRIHGTRRFIRPANIVIDRGAPFAAILPQHAAHCRARGAFPRCRCKNSKNKSKLIQTSKREKKKKKREKKTERRESEGARGRRGKDRKNRRGKLCRGRIPLKN